MVEGVETWIDYPLLQYDIHYSTPAEISDHLRATKWKLSTLAEPWISNLKHAKLLKFESKPNERLVFATYEILWIWGFPGDSGFLRDSGFPDFYNCFWGFLLGIPLTFTTAFGDSFWGFPKFLQKLSGFPLGFLLGFPWLFTNAVGDSFWGFPDF